MLILLVGCGGTNDEGISDAGRSDTENGSDSEDEDDPCGQTGFEEYAVVIKDGRIWDIQDHIDALPESPDTGF